MLSEVPVRPKLFSENFPGEVGILKNLPFEIHVSYLIFILEHPGFFFVQPAGGRGCQGSGGCPQELPPELLHTRHVFLTTVRCRESFCATLAVNKAPPHGLV